MSMLVFRFSVFYVQFMVIVVVVVQVCCVIGLIELKFGIGGVIVYVFVCVDIYGMLSIVVSSRYVSVCIQWCVRLKWLFVMCFFEKNCLFDWVCGLGCVIIVLVCVLIVCIVI